MAGHEESATKQSPASRSCKPQQLQHVLQNKSKKTTLFHMMSNSRFGMIQIWPGICPTTDMTPLSCQWIKSGHRSSMWPMGQFSFLRYDVKSQSCSNPSELIVWCLSRIHTTMKHDSHDLLVCHNGTVKHTLIISTAVNCEVNLFNYPFAADQCPVAIQTWTNGGEQGKE